MKSVLIVQGQMKQYRAPLFSLLYDLLRQQSIALTVAYSRPTAREAQRNDTCELPAEYGLKVKDYWLWPEKLLYQPLLQRALRSDLVIVEQANRYLLNHFLLPLSRAGLQRVAFWGHGRNQPERTGLSEWYRRKTLNSVSWWFAYTAGRASYLESEGVPASKITTLQNSMDTKEIREHVKKLTSLERAELRARLHISASAPVGIFCGVLDKSKNLPFLLEACRIIKADVPDFHLVVVGGGPGQAELQRRIDGVSWIHCQGPQFGRAKAELLAISDVFLLPSAVGLAILDAFAGGLPILTTRCSTHGPEMEYLKEGVNGLVTEHEPGAYAEQVKSLIRAKDFLARLQAGAVISAEEYSIENMAANFERGIRSCLGLGAASREVLGFQRAS